MPRWWDLPFDVQKRTSTQEGLQKFGSMPKRKSLPGSAPTSAAEAGTGTDGNDAANASDEEVEDIAEQAFPRRPSRPQGSKATKGELAAHSKREKIMQKQVLASERMAEASLLKATAMQDQCALSLFTMPTGEGLTEQARRYIEVRRTKEIERLEWCIESERRAAELAKLEHKRLLKEGSYEAPRSRRGRSAAAPTSPVVTAAPPRAPKPAIANAAVCTFLSSRPNVNFSSCFLISYKLASNPEWCPQWHPRPAMVLVVMRFLAMVDLQFPPMVIDLRWFCKSGTWFRFVALAFDFALLQVIFFCSSLLSFFSLTSLFIFHQSFSVLFSHSFSISLIFSLIFLLFVVSRIPHIVF